MPDVTPDSAETRRLLERVTTGTHDLADAPMVTDVAAFLSDDVFRQEVDRFFLGSPQVVGFAGQVRAPGSFLATEVVGRPLVVTRDADGVLRAFVNACAHRGARVVEDSGTGARLTCRFHGWTYSLDGQLAGRRQNDAFPAADRCGLTPLAVSDRSGLLVVAPTPEVGQDAVDGHLAGIEAQFAGFGFDHMVELEERRFDVEANWKLIAAVSGESYHFATLHRDTVARWLHDNAVFDDFGRHGRWAFALHGIERLADVPQEEWPAHPPGAISHVLFPGTVVITNGDSAQMIRTEPGTGPDATPSRSHVRYLGVCRDTADRDAELASYRFGGTAFETEDLPVVIETQRGLSARGGSIVVGRNEPMVQLMHRVWRDGVDDER